MKKINLTKGLKKSKLLRVRIDINSRYDMIYAWEAEDAYKFKTSVYDRLDALKGLRIKESEDLFTSPSLVSTNRFDKTEIYLHPKEFVGYASKADIKRIEKILSEASCVSGFTTEVEQVYDLDDDEYRELLSENIDKIIELVNEVPNKESPYAFVNFAFDFAKYNRVDRVGDHTGGYCSTDCDIYFINTCLLPIIKKCSLA